MPFIDVTLPAKISLGTSTGVQFKTDVITYGNGKEYVNSRWQYQRAVFDVAYTVKNRADAIEMYNFFLAAKGRFNSFRVTDELDYTSNPDGTSAPAGTDQLIGTGDGLTQQFQLTKTYSNGVSSYTRNITKPRAGFTIVSVNGSSVPFTIDTDTGIVTLATTPGVGEEVRAGYVFDIQARFDTDGLDSIDYILLRNADRSADRFSFPSLPIIEVL